MGVGTGSLVVRVGGGVDQAICSGRRWGQVRCLGGGVRLFGWAVGLGFLSWQWGWAIWLGVGAGLFLCFGWAGPVIG